MRCEWYLRGLKRHSIILAFLALGCRGAPSSTGGPSGKVVAANSKCTQSNAKKLADDPLSLVVDDALVDKDQAASVALMKMLRNGGYVDVGFWSVRSQLPEFKTKGKEFKTGGKEIKGNELGDVEVLNVPYCTSPSTVQAYREDWAKRCLNHFTQRKLDADPALKDKFFQAWKKPVLATKRCTAHFTIDPADVAVQNGRYRVRVWTAEHCYQPAYSTDVIMHVHVPVEKLKGVSRAQNGLYIPLPMNEPDPSVWRSKILAAGGSSDALRDEKILALRSTDGRSSKMFVDTSERFCRADVDSRLPSVTLGGSPAKYVDCYSMTEIATFKGTVVLSEATPAYKSSVEAANTLAARKVAVEQLVGEALSRKNQSNDDALVNVFAGPFANILGGRQGAFVNRLRASISLSQFMLSVFDGLQHGRRIEAFKEESGRFGITPDAMARHFGLGFSMRNVDLSGDPLRTFIAGVASVLAPDLSNAFCTIFSSSCSRMETRPLDTLAMEEFVLRNKAVGFDEFLLQRPNVLLMKLVNDQLAGDQLSLKVLSTDSAYVANLKFLSFQVKFWLDVFLLHENPGAGSPIMNSAAKVIQTLLQVGCVVQAEGVRLFPILGNVMGKNGYPTGYLRVLPANPRGLLTVAPYAVSNPDYYGKSNCAKMDVSPDKYAFARANETAYLVHVNDKALADRDLETYLSSRVVFKFPGKDSLDSGINDYGDSGSMLTFMGAPSFVLSTHNGEPVNGIVLAELPELNDPSTDPDAAPASCK